MFKLRPHQLRAVKSMQRRDKGQLIMPTGAGKTLCMIKDTEREFNGCAWDLFLKTPERKVTVVVAPRILLSQQLSEDFEESLGINPMLQYKILHVHSGDTHHNSTTNAGKILEWTKDNYRYNKLIFTTYHSLHRIQESGINVDTIYFDEAHNSVKRNFFPATEFFAGLEHIRCFFFTATPKHSYSLSHAGMNDKEVYGKVITKVSAPELVKQGVILPPKVVVKEFEKVAKAEQTNKTDCHHLIESIDEVNVDKILVCVRRTQQIINLVDEKNTFCGDLEKRGYDLLYITSKTGGYVNGEKVSRETFFSTLREWGNDKSKRFIIMHHSILSEGISVPGLEAALFMRNMNYITISQTIGRVIRKGDDDKKFGIVAVPVYDKVGISTAKSVNTVVDTIFQKGEAATSVVR